MQSLLLEEGVQAVLLLFLKVQKRTWKGGINNISMIQRFFILTMRDDASQTWVWFISMGDFTVISNSSQIPYHPFHLGSSIMYLRPLCSALQFERKKLST